MPRQVLQVYLRRSCKSPLVVVARAETFGAPQDDFLSTLVPHLDRVGHLDIHGFQARSYVAYRMELLSSMHIQDRCDSDSLEQELIFHDDHFPALKSLTLVMLEARPRIIGTLSSLTSLALRGVVFYTWDELFCFLGSCPALEDLVIERFGMFSEWSRAEDPVRLTRDRPTIELQHLRELYCAPRWDHETITFLLANLSLPSTAKIGVLMYLDFENEEYADILAMGQSVDLPDSTVIAGIVPEDKTFLPIFPAIRAVQTRIVRVGSDLSNSIVQVKALAMDDDLHIGGTSVTFTTGYVTDAFNPRSVQRIIQSELGTVFPSSLTALHMYVDDSDCYYDTRDGSLQLAESWKSLYEAFPQVEEFCAAEPILEFFTDFLYDIGPVQSIRTDTPPPWPKLTRIKFEYTGTDPDAGELEEVMQAITTSICARRDTVSVERLEHLTLTFPAEPPILRTYLGRLRGATDTLVCNIGGEELMEVDPVME